MPQSSDEAYIHNIGNLTMLPPGVNSSLKDRAPADKAVKYVECGMQSTMAVGRDIKQSRKWGKREVYARAAKIEAFVREEWGD